MFIFLIIFLFTAEMSSMFLFDTMFTCSLKKNVTLNSNTTEISKKNLEKIHSGILLI